MTAATKSIDLISKKQFCTCSTLFCTFHCHCFAQLKCETSWLNIFIYGGMSFVLNKNFVASILVHFCFFSAAHFHLAGCSLLAASIPHFLIFAMKFSCFSPTKSSSFSVIHLSVDKNNVKKDSTLLLFFCPKVREAMRLPAKNPLSCIWVAIPVD